MGRQFELEPDIGLEHRKPIPGGEMVKPIPQASDRLRRIGSVRWRLVPGHG
jgi:hypothetical protein